MLPNLQETTNWLVPTADKATITMISQINNYNNTQNIYTL